MATSPNSRSPQPPGCLASALPVNAIAPTQTHAANSRRIIRVFAASPGDVAEERRRLARVVDGLNERLAEHLGVQLELKEWRQVTPGMGRPEDVILEQLPATSSREFWQACLGSGLN
jgi:hypothetical protein